MDRRRFLKIGASACAIPLASGRLAASAYGSPLASLAARAGNDRVLVVVRLDGGNDGLNMVLPLDQYANLSKARANILIPEAKALKLTAATGLHPALGGLAKMYADGRLRVIQSVGYPNHNQSHFRSTDIWFSASDYNQVLSTGWLGRYLETVYPGYPEGYPSKDFPDPPAIQIGSSLYTLLQGSSVPMGMAVANVASIYSLVPAGYDTAPDTPAGHELTFIRQMFTETQKYGEAIKKAAAAAVNKSTLYPATGNALSDQLKGVARLIAGGLRTKVYVVTLRGFDTHANQVLAADVTTGAHALLLAKLNDAIVAFQDDLRLLGIEHRVMGMTMSEFGRRILSNASLGTDHGTSAPLFVWGAGVSGGLLGTNPAIPATVTVKDNIAMQFDYRSVYTGILKDWMGVAGADLQTVMLKDFPALPLVGSPVLPRGPAAPGAELEQNFPNPFRGATTLRYRVDNGDRVRLRVFDARGTMVRVVVDGFHAPGSYARTLEAGSLRPGTYIYRLEMGGRTLQRPMEVLR
ncbi:MAG TPA: DUF1501 domain-containing protein [Fibrobacteria bacterium]|nr:DUF1501 domain-containing protein [Fibrobacteria bacterium]